MSPSLSFQAVKKKNSLDQSLVVMNNYPQPCFQVRTTVATSKICFKWPCDGGNFGEGGILLLLSLNNYRVFLKSAELHAEV